MVFGAEKQRRESFWALSFSRGKRVFFVFFGGGGNIPNSINCFSFAIIYNDINYIYVLETKYLNFTFISFVNIEILNIERN